MSRLPTAAVTALVLVLAACSSPSPTPSTAPRPIASAFPSPVPSGAAPSRAAVASAAPAPSAPAKVVGPLPLEACDLLGYVPCEQQATVLAIPLAGTGLALTYSTEWAPGRLDRPAWEATSLGLAGWSVDVLQR